MSKLANISLEILKLYYSLCELEWGGLYDSDEYNIALSVLKEKMKEERALYSSQNEIDAYIEEGVSSHVLFTRLRNHLEFIKQFPQTAFLNGRIDVMAFRDPENRKRAIKNVVRCDVDKMVFKFLRDEINSCEDYNIKIDLVNHLYIAGCMSSWSGRELVEEKFIPEDVYMLKSYFYADMIGLDREYIKESFDIMCMKFYLCALEELFQISPNSEKSEDIANWKKALCFIKTSVTLMSDKSQEKAGEQLYFKTFPSCSNIKAFEDVKNIINNKDGLKENYKVLTFNF